MDAILPTSLVALINYYMLLWRTPCVSISLLVCIGHSRVLTAWYKAYKWLQRVILQRGSELGRIARLAAEAAQDPDGFDTESDGDPERSEGEDEIRLLRDQSRRERQSDVYAKWRTDYSISHSRTLKEEYRSLYAKATVLASAADDVSATVCETKHISARLAPRLSSWLAELREMQVAIQDTVLAESKLAYSPTDPHYQRRLKILWKALHYDAKKATMFEEDEGLSPVSTKHWQDIGFQGADPSTDWRSSGRLGLTGMIYFSDLHADNREGRLIVQQAIRGVAGDGETLGWYPFALSYITIIDFLLRLIPLHLASYVFLSSPLSSVEQTFHHLAALLVRHFHDHWIYLQTSEHHLEATQARPVVMDYERISKRWKIEIAKWLERGKIGGWVDSRGLTFFEWGDAPALRRSGEDEKVDVALQAESSICPS